MGTNEPDSTKMLWQPKPKHLSTCFARNCLKSYLSQKWWDSMLCFKFSSCFPSVLWGKKRFNCTLLVLQVSRTKNNLSKKGFPHNFSHTLQKVVLKKKLLKTFFLVKICFQKKSQKCDPKGNVKENFFSSKISIYSNFLFIFVLKIIFLDYHCDVCKTSLV